MRDRQTENATETRVSSTPGYSERDTLEHVCRRCPNRSSFGCWFGLPMVCIWLLAVEWSIIIGSDLISVPDRSSLGTERRRQRKRPLAPPSSFLALHAHTNPIPCLGVKTHPDKNTSLWKWLWKFDFKSCSTAHRACNMYWRTHLAGWEFAHNTCKSCTH